MKKIYKITLETTPTGIHVTRENGAENSQPFGVMELLGLLTVAQHDLMQILEEEERAAHPDVERVIDKPTVLFDTNQEEQPATQPVVGMDAELKAAMDAFKV